MARSENEGGDCDLGHTRVCDFSRHCIVTGCIHITVDHGQIRALGSDCRVLCHRRHD